MKAARAAGLLLLTLSGAVFIFTSEVFAGDPVAVKIRDLTSIEGVRENPLIGYGMGVGLTQTGDSQQTVFTTQTLANIMQSMGAQIVAATAGAAAGQECAGVVGPPQPAGIRPARHPSGRYRLLDRRCQEPRRRRAPADSALWRGRASLCRGPGPDRRARG